MAVRSTKIDAHWNYFLSVERDLERLSCFVEFDERNYECFSVEIARLLIAAAAEADVVCKQICRKLNVSSDATKLHEYREPILTAYPLVPHFEVPCTKLWAATATVEQLESIERRSPLVDGIQ
jgi:hypothetical protein